MAADWIAALALVLCAACVVLGSLILVAAAQARLARPLSSLFQPAPAATVFLFDGERLLDATPDALSLLPEGDDLRIWARVLARLGPMFPGLGPALETLPQVGRVVLNSAPNVVPPVVLRAEHLTGLTRLTLLDGLAGRNDVVALAAMEQEVAVQRSLLTQAPVLIWREDAAGAVIWANHAYMIRAAERVTDAGGDLTWPLPALFDRVDAPPGPTRARLRVGAASEWFDLVRLPLAGETLCYGLAANAAVQAETTLRDFMQTLTKTFADLPIGLAIFDRARVLQMFNPALSDLIALPPEFLIARPTLAAMLDAMRAKAMLPEPKDYRSWRKQLTRVEEEAAMGLFEETWSLPGGRSYRVIGRPHPNGALAFMFEDISSEMTRTRRYRADLELGQSVIDAVEEAVAVFSQGGQLVMSNLAYARLWNHDPAVLLSDAGISTLCAWWRDHSAPSLLWEDALEFVAALGDRSPWQGEVRLLDGRLVECRFRPLADGATLVTFSLWRGDRTQPLSVPQRLSA